MGYKLWFLPLPSCKIEVKLGSDLFVEMKGPRSDSDLSLALHLSTDCDGVNFYLLQHKQRQNQTLHMLFI